MEVLTPVPANLAKPKEGKIFSWWRSVAISVYFSLEGSDIFSKLVFCFLRTGHKVVQTALLINILIHPGR